MGFSVVTQEQPSLQLEDFVLAERDGKYSICEVQNVSRIESEWRVGLRCKKACLESSNPIQRGPF